MTRSLYLCLAALLLPLIIGCSGGSNLSAGPSGVTLRTYYQTAPNDAPWVAFQDGDGPWQQLAPTSTGVYSAPVTDAGGRYSLAVAVSTKANQPRLHLYHATTRELPVIECDVIEGIAPPTTTVTGTVSGFPQDAISAKVGWSGNITPDTPTYSFQYAGLHDLVATIRTPFSFYSPRKIAFQRNVPANPGGTITTDFDFSAVPETRPATIAVGNGPAIYADMRMITANGTPVQLAYENSGPITSFPCVYPASSQRVAGDVYAVQLSGSGPNQFNVVEQFFTRTGDHTVTLPQPFTGDASAGLDTANLPTASWQTYPGADYYYFDYRQSPSIFFMRDWFVLVSPDWLRGTTSYTAPDLSSVPGWQSALMFDGPLNLIIAEAHTTTGNISQALNAWYTKKYGPAPANLTHTYARTALLINLALAPEILRNPVPAQ